MMQSHGSIKCKSCGGNLFARHTRRVGEETRQGGAFVLLREIVGGEAHREKDSRESEGDRLMPKTERSRKMVLIISVTKAQELVTAWKGHLREGTDIKSCKRMGSACPIHKFFLFLERELKGKRC